MAPCRISGEGGTFQEAGSRAGLSIISMLCPIRISSANPSNVAIFSDIHGNLPALDAVLSDLQSHHIDAVHCLGDLVGYAVFPNEVIDRIRRAQIPTVMLHAARAGCVGAGPIRSPAVRHQASDRRYSPKRAAARVRRRYRTPRRPGSVGSALTGMRIGARFSAHRAGELSRERAVYASDQQHLVIPVGSRVLGKPLRPRQGKR